MKDLGSKLAVGGFAAQGAAGLALGLMYVFAGDSLSDVFAGQTGGALAAAAGALSTLSGAGMTACAAGFSLRYLDRRRGADLAVAALMILSLVIALFTPQFAALQPILGWAYMAVMAVTALRRRKPALSVGLAAALLLQIASGPLAALLPDAPVPQGLFSCFQSLLCYTALTLYPLLVAPAPPEKEEGKKPRK